MIKRLHPKNVEISQKVYQAGTSLEREQRGEVAPGKINNQCEKNLSLLQKAFARVLKYLRGAYLQELYREIF